MLDLIPTPPSLTSALPPEVLGHITNILADSLNISNVKDLKSLALVCKAFLPFCTALIFSQIDASGRFENGRYRTQGQRLRRLSQVFTANPKLPKHVRKLEVHLDGGKESYELYVRYQNTILGFPNLIYLSSGAMAKPGPGSAVLAWQWRMIEHYLAQNTLCGLRIQSMADLDFEKVLGCASLREISLTGVQISSSIATTPSILGNNIFKIQIYGHSLFPLSVLSHLPCLKALSLTHVKVIPSSLSEARCPSMMLESLCLYLKSIDDLRAFCDFYKHHAQISGSRPFEHLQKFKTHIRDVEEAIISQTLLQDVKYLVSLDIHCMCYIDAQPNLLLEHHFQATFSRLTSFDLKIGLRKDSNSDQVLLYEQTMSLVCGLFERIPHMNVLETVSIFVKDDGWHYQEDEMDPTNIPTNPWGELAYMLASPQRFPRLHHVDFSLVLGYYYTSTRETTSITSWKPENAPETPFSFLIASMVSLGHRLGDEFNLFIF
ncbi:hypothetical protein CVT24_007422 [Panaeolus cyanescens]|uniref:F-box domain-containing protein n=1 Tax=Panaeolus cyanescens TaxID=181874 RepID=A0A409YKW5_9AGAR|nr:hypothetical protein CVT24_007422 [Panaeolus cyanescens]